MAAFIRSGVMGISKTRALVASKMALAMAPPVQTMEGQGGRC
jgi:hypothetical protein